MAIDTDAILEVVRAHMEAQPYCIQYSDGELADCQTEIDSDGDLTITVKPPEHFLDRIEELEQEFLDQIKELEQELEDANNQIVELQEQLDEMQSES